MSDIPLHPELEAITKRIEARSNDSRTTYLELMRSYKPEGLARQTLSEGNLAHAAAACPIHDKQNLLGGGWPNIGIVTAYNDMLSAHQPYEHYPELIRKAARDKHATAQVAGGVPAMCDGVTQGQNGMELSLFSRDVIAMATAISLSHNVFDAALYLGVCDKIVPGLVIGALRFGWLPSIFVPAGPMPSGLPNPEKARIRQQFAAGEVDRKALLKAESESYHSAGTCTFYGTANSNQMMMEMMGLHLPGAAFINPGTPLRQALNEAAVHQVLNIAITGNYTPIGPMFDARSFVNAIVGLMATGGSTNHTLHIPAMAAAAGIILDWDDFADLSRITPLLTRVYPNGIADINHFHAAGGMGFVVRELLQAGLMHKDASNIMGKNMMAYAREPMLKDGKLAWRDAPKDSLDLDILRPVHSAFSSEGGLKLLTGPLGRAVIKISAVKQEHRRVRAPARIFDSQDAVLKAFKAGELDCDVNVVLRFQGPAANGMPELHKLTPALGVLQDKGFKVGLITDGRMSGASGKVPAAIHISPEAAKGGMLARLQDGDILDLDAEKGKLALEVDDVELAARKPAPFAPNRDGFGTGRELFVPMRRYNNLAEQGASLFDGFMG